MAILSVTGIAFLLNFILLRAPHYMNALRLKSVYLSFLDMFYVPARKIDMVAVAAGVHILFHC